MEENHCAQQKAHTAEPLLANESTPAECYERKRFARLWKAQRSGWRATRWVVTATAVLYAGCDGFIRLECSMDTKSSC